MFQFDLNNLLSVRLLVCLFVVLLPRLSYTLLYPSISERARKKCNFFHRRFFAFPSARFLSNRIHYSWMAELWVSFLTSFAFPSSKCWQIYSILKIMYFHSVLYSFCVVCLNLLTEQQASHFVHPYIRAHTMGIIIWKQACHTCLLHSHSIFPLPLSLFIFSTIFLSLSLFFTLSAGKCTPSPSFHSSSPRLPFVLSFIKTKISNVLHLSRKRNTQKNVKTKEQ